MTPAKRSKNWLPSIINDFFGNEWMEKSNLNAPAINIKESERQYDIEIAAPGMTKEDFKIRIENDSHLVVTMEKKEERKEGDRNGEGDQGRYLRREFFYSHFQQSMILPENIDKTKIDAHVENGILKIEIPKKEIVPQEPGSQEIQIR